MVVRGNTARRDPSTVLFADFVLCHKPNIPLAVVEAKDNGHASHDPEQLLADYARLQGEAQGLRDELRDILAKSLGDCKNNQVG